MYESYLSRLRCLREDAPPEMLRGGLKGIEKESLRVTEDGRLAQTPHPRVLGSALTHPAITTDYSEALLEFITEPHADVTDAIAELGDIHRYTATRIGDEILWATSMPCALDGEDGIPIADYGGSNVGFMKHVYRRGLAWRYGKVMQTIAGSHFNYSLPDSVWPLLIDCEGSVESVRAYRDDAYFALVRNFQRYGWLVPYLAGASPAICRSFAPEGLTGFSTLGSGTMYLPHATSLRMSDIGYKNEDQAGMGICYNSLSSYVRTLTRAITTPWPRYQEIGTQVDGEWRQLNCNRLQIENEYYSFVRPKQIAESGERPTLALERRGVAYVEIRALDIDPDHPEGVSEPMLRFLELFLIFCALQDSPVIDDDERREIERNQRLAATCGRQPGLLLGREGEAIGLRDWGLELVEALQPLAELMDSGADAPVFTEALIHQRRKLTDPDLTPSARQLATLADHGQSFFRQAMETSRSHMRSLQEPALSPDQDARYSELARRSLEAQAAVEAADGEPFEVYLARYFE